MPMAAGRSMPSAPGRAACAGKKEVNLMVPMEVKHGRADAASPSSSRGPAAGKIRDMASFTRASAFSPGRSSPARMA